jgi:hypothetical protein
MATLTVKFVRAVPSDVGPQAELVLFEPNGDPLPCRCLLRGEISEVNTDQDQFGYLQQRYGHEYVIQLVRSAVLSNAMDGTGGCSE